MQLTIIKNNNALVFIENIFGHSKMLYMALHHINTNNADSVLPLCTTSAFNQPAWNIVACLKNFYQYFL